ncbi:hypothetical protein RYX36_037208 [Vicia faba]
MEIVFELEHELSIWRHNQHAPAQCLRQKKANPKSNGSFRFRQPKLDLSILLNNNNNNLLHTIDSSCKHSSSTSMNSSGGSNGGGGMMGFSKSSPFTVSQWQELEHQALIFKYMVAGLPVPPDLVLPFHSHNFFHHSIPTRNLLTFLYISNTISNTIPLTNWVCKFTVSYCSFYGKKVDPEPGRCRRTDGKKWRCSKEAYPDSKYCERHMHRGRNRSRKPVESQTTLVAAPTTTPPNFHTTNAFATHLDTIPYGIPSKEYRYLQGLKSEGGEHSCFAEASGGGNKCVQMESQLENIWPLMSTRVSSFSASKSSNNSMVQSDYPQHSFLSTEYGSGEAVKEEGQPLRSFFNEWPKSRESWSGLEDERSNQTAFSTTQLSISIPMSSSDFSATSS